MSLLIDFVYGVLTLVAGPVFWLRRRLGGKPLAPVRERWNGVPERAQGAKPVIWVHGVSVGEIRAARRLIEVLSDEHPDVDVVVTSTTVAGLEVARREHPRRSVFYCPFDFSACVRRAYARLRPCLLVLVELELWPNLLGEAGRRGVPVVVVNGKVSERSLKGYRWLKRLAPGFLGPIRLFCLQNEVYAARLKELGVAPDRVFVTGTTKADYLDGTVKTVEPARLRAELGLDGEGFLLVAGSTHPGEEEAALDAYRAVLALDPKARLIIAPRHMNRAEVACAAALKQGFSVVRRSSPARLEGCHHVLVLDTIGELDKVFVLADCVFLGGSLVPVGGHNILEPAAHGRAIIVGPHTWTIASIVEEVQGAGGLVVVADAASLREAVCDLARDPGRRRAIGEAARAVVERHRGATRRTADRLNELLRAATRPPLMADASRRA